MDQHALGHRLDDDPEPALGVLAGGLGLVQGGEVFDHPDGRAGAAAPAQIDRGRPRHQGHAPAVGTVHDDVVAHGGPPLDEGQVDGQLLHRVRGAVRPKQPVDLGQVFESRRRVFALPQQLPGAGVDEDRQAARPVDEEDAGRQVADEGVEHVRRPAEVVGEGALLGDVGHDPLPADEPTVSVPARGERVAQPAGGGTRQDDLANLRAGGRIAVQTGRDGGREAVFAGDGLILAGELLERGEDHLAILGVDARHPARVITEQVDAVDAHQFATRVAD